MRPLTKHTSAELLLLGLLLWLAIERPTPPPWAAEAGRELAARLAGLVRLVLAWLR